MPTEPLSALTVALIVKNEAHHLDACLRTVANLAGEILIVDSGSEDETLDIAARYPRVRIVSHHDWQGFGHQRRTGQSHVRTPWLFWIDADERVTPQLAQSIRDAVQTNADDAVYSVARLSWVFGRFIRHSGWYPDRVVRLYRTDMTGYSDDRVHESVIVPQCVQTVPLQGDLLHYTYRDLQHYLVKSAHYAHLWAEARKARGRRASITQGILHGIGCFLRMYVFKAGFLDGRQGFLLALLSAHSTFAKYAALWLLDQPASDQPPPGDDAASR